MYDKLANIASDGSFSSNASSVMSIAAFKYAEDFKYFTKLTKVVKICS